MYFDGAASVVFGFFEYAVLKRLRQSLNVIVHPAAI
jgi:hypothetical protein